MGSKGKMTNDPIRFLPVLPSKRSKPQWQEQQPSFVLTKKSRGPSVDDQRRGTVDLVSELTASGSSLDADDLDDIDLELISWIEVEEVQETMVWSEFVSSTDQ